MDVYYCIPGIRGMRDGRHETAGAAMSSAAAGAASMSTTAVGDAGSSSAVVGGTADRDKQAHTGGQAHGPYSPV